MNQKITPFLWFNDNAEEAVKFYTRVFKGSKVRKIARYTKATEKVSGRSAGSVMTIEFELMGQRFVALNGGPSFEFDEAISFVINCKTQKEVDYYWDKLSAGGKAGPCGWLKDRFGVSWQVVPDVIWKFISSKDRKASERVMTEVLKTDKLDIQTLKDAYSGHSRKNKKRKNP